MVSALEEGRSPLLSPSGEIIWIFSRRAQVLRRHIVAPHSSSSAKERRLTRERLQSIPPNEERLFLATGRYIGEGFDDARLDTLFLALPGSWKGTLVQYSGRLHHLDPGKTGVRIVDYVDRGVPMLRRMFQRRLRGYRAIGSPPAKNGPLGE